MAYAPVKALVVPLGAAALFVPAACSGGGDEASADEVASVDDADEAGDDTADSTISEADGQAATLAFAKRMREHGIDWPDPILSEDGGSYTELPDSIDTDSPAVVAADEGCQKEIYGDRSSQNGEQP